MATREVEEIEAETEITIKIRGARRFIEIAKVTELRDPLSGAALSRNKHREAIDIAPVDAEGVPVEQSAGAALERLAGVLGQELAEQVAAVALHGR